MSARKKYSLIFIVLALLLLIGAVVAYTIYGWIERPNVLANEDKIIYVPTGSNYADIKTILDTSNVLLNKVSFDRVAKWMHYSDPVIKSGKYTIKSGWNNRQIIGTLRSGNQTPINLIINNVRTLPEVAGQISKQIELDSNTLITFLTDSNTLNKYNYSRENMLTMFIPNTYQLYWNTSVEDLTDRIKNEHDKFWSQNGRADKAKKINLTSDQVYTLASIVEKETQAKVERPTVAGLYLNRLEEGIPLQADPTVVFANGLFDLRRVLNIHLEIDSPYNTYKNSGLPPGPIYMPTIESLDAVLNAEEHTYLYMCARPDNSGLHAFASDLSGHAINAARYRKWLNQRGIR